tara:strand:- start:156 stop:353 length:198 start_codon:yes stop_codon:yes gene_type:complete
MLKKSRNLLPYFIIIAIYFFFINLEARKHNNEKLLIEKMNNTKDNQSNLNDKNLRLKIPVIPYNQ